MNELDIETADAEFEKLLRTCEEESSKMLNENRKNEYFVLKSMCMRMSEIRYKMRLAKGFLNIWYKVGDAEYESDFKRLANYCFNDLAAEPNIDIICDETFLITMKLMGLLSCWWKLCRFYQTYYALKFAYAINNEM